MNINRFFHVLFTVAVLATSCKGQTQAQPEVQSPPTETTADYVTKSGSVNGIGRWYQGREIAHVMGFQGMEWLERPEREKEENSALLLKNMDIQPADNIADIGAGSGYHVFKMATMAANGMVYAVDIQPEMLQAMQQKKEVENFSNVELVLGGEQTVNLPENSIDKILMVDVYHEFNFPIEMIASMKSALKKEGEIYLIEYRGEDPNIPIKTIHKMSEAQAVKEFAANGFKLKENIDNLPWQHCMVFVKE